MYLQSTTCPYKKCELKTDTRYGGTRKIISTCDIPKNTIVCSEIGFFCSNYEKINNGLICHNCGKTFNIGEIDNGFSCDLCSYWFCKRKSCQYRKKIHFQVCYKINMSHLDKLIEDYIISIIELSYYENFCQYIMNNLYYDKEQIKEISNLDEYDKYLDLFNSNVIKTSSDIIKLEYIINKNSFSSELPIFSDFYDTDFSHGYIVAKWSSYFNHCCLPNTIFYIIGNRICIKTIRDISANTEICISYHGPYISFQNKEYIYKVLGFECKNSCCQNKKRKHFEIESDGEELDGAESDGGELDGAESDGIFKVYFNNWNNWHECNLIQQKLISKYLSNLTHYDYIKYKINKLPNISNTLLVLKKIIGYILGYILEYIHIYPLTMKLANKIEECIYIIIKKYDIIYQKINKKILMDIQTTDYKIECFVILYNIYYKLNNKKRLRKYNKIIKNFIQYEFKQDIIPYLRRYKWCLF